MSLMRFAGDALAATSGKKRGATLGSINSGGDALGIARAIGSQVHPLAGAVDDIISVGEKTQKTNTSSNIQDWGENIVGSIGSGLSAIGSVGSLLGIKSAAAATPIGATIGLSTMIAKPAVEGMRDPKIRNADANQFRQAMGR